MRQNLTDREVHALYCPVKNTKSALFLVACFSLVAIVNWKGLHKAPDNPSFVVLIFAIIAVAMLAKWLVAFTCFLERLLIGLFIVSLVIGELKAFVPSVFGHHVEMVMRGKVVLWLLGLLVSLTMLVQSVRNPNVLPRNAEMSIARQPKHNLTLLLVIILTVLVLGALLYLLPFGQ